jgi:hypothetical protein
MHYREGIIVPLDNSKVLQARFSMLIEQSMKTSLAAHARTEEHAARLTAPAQD